MQRGNAYLRRFMKRKAEQTPAELGFGMPAEWERHDATWLSVPHNQTDWPGERDTLRLMYGDMHPRIAQGDLVRILVNNKKDEDLARSSLVRSGANLI